MSPFVMRSSMDGNPLRIVLCTAPPNETKSLARVLLSKKLAACVNIVSGVMSFYEWHGELCEDSEALLIIKTRVDLIDQLNECIYENHSYDTVEILAIHVDEGDSKYMNWVREVTRPDS